MKKDIKTELMGIASLCGVLPDSHIDSLMLDLVYSRNKENTMKLFLEIQEKDKKRIKKKNQKLYMGLEGAMNSFVGLSRALLDGKNKRKANDYLDLIIKDGNIAYMIDVCKAYFPDGKPGGASNNGRWYFEQFKNMLLENKENFEEGGKDRRWAKSFDHLDYIELVLKED